MKARLNEKLKVECPEQEEEKQVIRQQKAEDKYYMDKMLKDEETENISISHVLGVRAIQIHNRYYDFNPTMRRLLEEIAKEQAPFILDIGYSSDDSGMTLTVYYT